ncbi:YqaE/Pmp3 family membrane protein [Candidatus Bipolaricaulota bacterium]|nr:YqaE/Pmp3 family membrane protein [Candidatus Bipolaricaulota bacterium]
MRYLLALLLPPVAVLSTGKLFTALLNLGLTLLGFIPGIIHAILIVQAYNADRRAKKYGK